MTSFLGLVICCHAIGMVAAQDHGTPDVGHIFIGDNTIPAIFHAPLPEPSDDSNILESRFNLISLSFGSYVDGIDYDPGNRLVYWNDYYYDQICRISIDGESPQETVITTGQPTSIALDLRNGKIYWAGYNQGGAISSANLDGSSVNRIYTYDATVQPTFTLFDPFSEYLFWTTRAGEAEIAKVHLNSGDKEVVKPIKAEPMGLERCADDTTRLFYYTNFTRLGVMNADGSADRTIEVFSTQYYGYSPISKHGSKLFWLGVSLEDVGVGIYEYDLKFSSFRLLNKTVTMNDGSQRTISYPSTIRIISNVLYDEPVAIEGCPENIEVEIDDNATNTVNTLPVHWAEPVLNSLSSCPRMDFLGPGSNGGHYPVAATQVSYQATDAAGNSDTCTFTVTVRRASVNIETTETAPTIGTILSTEKVKERSTETALITNQPTLEVTSNTKNDLTSSPTTTTMTNLSPALIKTGSLPCISAGVGEGIVIIILMVVVIALSLYILQLRKTKNDSNCAQQTQPLDAGQSSMSTDKDTGSNHGFEDVKEAGSSQSPDGEVQDSSKIYEQNHDSALDPNNSIQLQHSCTMSKNCSRIYV